MKGDNAFKIAAKKLGLNVEKASNILNDIKKSVQRGGKDNVWIDPKSGDIISPQTGEVLGNLADYE